MGSTIDTYRGAVTCAGGVTIAETVMHRTLTEEGPRADVGFVGSEGGGGTKVSEGAGIIGDRSVGKATGIMLIGEECADVR